MENVIFAQVLITKLFAIIAFYCRYKCENKKASNLSGLLRAAVKRVNIRHKPKYTGYTVTTLNRGDSCKSAKLLY